VIPYLDGEVHRLARQGVVRLQHVGTRLNLLGDRLTEEQDTQRLAVEGQVDLAITNVAGVVAAHGQRRFPAALQLSHQVVEVLCGGLDGLDGRDHGPSLA